MKKGGYIGKVSNQPAQVVKGPHVTKGGKSGTVKRGGDLRNGSDKSGK